MSFDVVSQNFMKKNECRIFSRQSSTGRIGVGARVRVGVRVGVGVRVRVRVRV